MKKVITAFVAVLTFAGGPAVAGYGCGGGGHGGGVPLALMEGNQPNPHFSAEELAHPWGWLHRLFGKQDQSAKKAVSEQRPTQKQIVQN
jgi:hypothetical protein